MFANQVAVITGASSGIGWSLAKELSRQGAKVGLVTRRRENLEKLAAEIAAAGGTAAIAAADVGERRQIVAAIRDLERQLGPIDQLVANAGVGTPTRLEPMNVEEIERTFQVNVLGVVYAIEAALPDMLSRKATGLCFAHARRPRGLSALSLRAVLSASLPGRCRRRARLAKHCRST